MLLGTQTDLFWKDMLGGTLKYREDMDLNERQSTRQALAELGQVHTWFFVLGLEMDGTTAWETRK